MERRTPVRHGYSTGAAELPHPYRENRWRAAFQQEGAVGVSLYRATWL